MIDITNIPELQEMTEENGSLRVGAANNFSCLMNVLKEKIRTLNGNGINNDTADFNVHLSGLTTI